MNTIEELEKAGILQKAVEFARPFLTTITGLPLEKTRLTKFIGTGFFIRYNDSVYIATAHHVVADHHKYRSLYYGVGGKSRPIQDRVVAATIPNADFCILSCAKELTSSEAALDLKDEKFASNHSKKTYYLVIGFPGNLHTHIPVMRHHTSGILPVFTVLKSTEMNSSGQEISFSLNYSGSNPDPPGMSGSPVWNLNIHLTSMDEWNIQCMSLAGIVTRWDIEEGTILATNSELIKDALPYS